MPVRPNATRIAFAALAIAAVAIAAVTIADQWGAFRASGVTLRPDAALIALSSAVVFASYAVLV